MINQKLRDHTTQIAFHLTLSRTMIGTLQSIKMDQMLYEAGMYAQMGFTEHRDWLAEQNSARPSLFITGFRALDARGLAEYINRDKYDPAYKKKMTNLAAPYFQLTSAGEKIWDLLIMAGLVPELQLPANISGSTERKTVKRRG